MLTDHPPPGAPAARSLRAFVEENTVVVAPPLLPEIRLHLATEVTPLWRATERELALGGIEPPFWAFAWAGGQALARYLLDVPGCVRGRSVLDFASGSGLVAIAAALAGARSVTAVEIDPLAGMAIALNAARNGVAIEVRVDAIVGAEERLAEVVVAGDVCYDRAMAAEVVTFLRGQARAGATVLLGDPGRAYLPSTGLREIAAYSVPVIDDVESTGEKRGWVYEVLGDAREPASDGGSLGMSRGATA
jgi:predicted nicotinamide N-methyase